MVVAKFKFVKRNNFRIGRLHFRITFSNIFVTFTDLKNKVIANISAGRCLPGNKRAKKSTQVIIPMVEHLSLSLAFHKVSGFELWLKSRYSWHVRTLIQEFALRNVGLHGLIDKRPVAHNGVRSRNPRRV